MSKIIVTITEMKPVQRKLELDKIEVMTCPYARLDCSACGKDCVKGKPIGIAWGEGRGWRLCHRCIANIEEDDHREMLEEWAPKGSDFL